mgnify:CR=1 FL=1|tara:strand:- start:271 stop:822 length:552 start_codon:yes stop_codon:yes gene_type:complete
MLQERVDKYHNKYPKYSKLIINRDCIEGIWVMGNNYQTKTNLYGAYPHGYLERIYTLFPLIPKKSLHLFSGSLPESEDYDKVDFNTGINAEDMSNILPHNFYERIYADPPYSIEDCDHYGCCMVKRNKVFNECYKIMKSGGILIWLDQVLPNYKKIQFKIEGRIGMVKSTNHRFRVITIFKKI